MLKGVKEHGREVGNSQTKQTECLNTSPPRGKSFPDGSKMLPQSLSRFIYYYRNDVVSKGE